jgi:hypothetical protein
VFWNHPQQHQLDNRFEFTVLGGASQSIEQSPVVFEERYVNREHDEQGDLRSKRVKTIFFG